MRGHMRQRKPTYDELYLDAVRIKAEFVAHACDSGNNANVSRGSSVIDELNTAIAHYKNLADVRKGW